MRVSRLKTVAVVCLVCLVGCGGSNGGAGTGRADKPVIAATIYPLADLARQIVGEHAKVVCLIPPGISPHGYEPNADQMQALRRATVLVRVGLGFDDWAEHAAKAAGNPALTIVNFAKTVHLTDAGESAGDTGADHRHDDAHGLVNAHLWLDPVLCGRFVRSLGARLAEVIGGEGQALRRKTADLVAQLGQLNNDYAAALKRVATRKLITVHAAFNRLVERYGLEVVVTLMPDEGPGAMTSGRLDAAMAAIRRDHLKVIFAEPQFPPDTARVLARQTGATVMTLDPLGDPAVPERAGYLPMMRYNLRTLVAGLNRPDR